MAASCSAALRGISTSHLAGMAERVDQIVQTSIVPSWKGGTATCLLSDEGISPTSHWRAFRTDPSAFQERFEISASDSHTPADLQRR